MTDLSENERVAVAAASKKIHRLADDLDRIVKTGWPSIDELKDAPILENWRVENGSLVGTVFGHPLLPTGRTAETSTVVFGSNTCVRTMSRWWRLGLSQSEKMGLARPVIEFPADAIEQPFNPEFTRLDLILPDEGEEER